MNRFSRLGIAALLVTQAAAAWAQEYPSREIRFICGFAAGSGADIMYRFLAEKVQALAGKPVIVENRPGALGHVATAIVAKAKPDGYTILPAGGTGLASMGFLLKSPPADPLKDFDYIGSVIRQGWYLSVAADGPIKSIADLTKHLKTKGEKGSYATATGTGTVFAELYKLSAGLGTVRINYKAIGDSLNDLQSGAIDMSMTDPPFTISNRNNGRIRPLAVSTAQRVAATPDIPTMAESGFPEIDIDLWWSIQVPAGTPKPIRDTIGKWFAEVLVMEDTKKFFANIGTDTFVSTPEQTRAMIVRDIEKWREYVRKAKIDPI